MSDFPTWIASHTDSFVLWVGAICTLGLYTVLYRENKIYRFFEHVFLGLATGYLIEQTWTDVLLPKWWVPMWDHGQWWYVWLLSAGALYYLIYSPKYNWLARLMIGLFLGVASGQTFQAVASEMWPQIKTSFKTVLPHPAIPAIAGPNGHPALPAVPPTMALNNLIFVVILLSVMSYFFFSFEHKHVVARGSARLGRWMMMFAFGAIFGTTVMGRLALLIDRVDFLLNDFGGAMGGPVVGPRIMLAFILGLAGLMVVLAHRERELPEEE